MFNKENYKMYQDITERYAREHSIKYYKKIDDTAFLFIKERKWWMPKFVYHWFIKKHVDLIFIKK